MDIAHNSPLVQALRAMKVDLTPETYIKGEYFAKYNDRICFCLHGAAQKQINSDIQLILEQYKNNPSRAASRARENSRGEGAAFNGKQAILLHKEDFSYQQLWDNKPKWVKEEGVELHYLLGMVGATTRWNDLASTTLEMVHAKIDEAIAIVIELGI